MKGEDGICWMLRDMKVGEYFHHRHNDEDKERTPNACVPCSKRRLTPILSLKGVCTMRRLTPGFSLEERCVL